MRALLVGLLATAALAASLTAQQRAALQIGAPIRVSGFELPRGEVTGLLAGVTRDSILIGVSGGIEALRLPRAACSHLYLRVGRQSGSGHAARLGIAIGGALGGVLAIAERNRTTTPMVFIVAGGAGGAMLGGLVGEFIFRVPRWQEAPLEWLDDLVAEP